jgi:dUTP pyrophosphatase
MTEVFFRKLRPEATPPQRMTEHAAGYDLFACCEGPVTIRPGKLEAIPTGIALHLPSDHEAQVRPRSGLALKHRIGVLNSPGTIDADYRGEVLVLLYNFGDEDFVVQPMARIAQLVVAHCETVRFVETETLEDTVRGAGGFGHTAM